MIEFVKEFGSYLRAHKKLWLLPIMLVLVLFGGMLILAEGTAFAPFVYTLF